MKIFIPIKHNSQRVPRKNFRLFGQEPLYKHCLMRYTNHEVFVDTDSDEIVEEITQDKRLRHVTVFRRNEKLVGDTVSVCDLIGNFITQFNIEAPLAQIHVTSPFLSESTLVDAFSYINKYDSVVACTEHKSRFWRWEPYGACPVNHNPLKMEQTQDLPSLYEENSAFYIFRPEVLSGGSRIGKNPYFYPVSYPENLDIDTEEDWEAALKEIK